MAHRQQIQPAWLHEQTDAILLDVVVAPRGSRTRVMGTHDGRLKIQMAAPPTESQANMLLVHFLAQSLGVARAQIGIVGGAANRRKTVRLAGVSTEKVLLALAPVKAPP